MKILIPAFLALLVVLATGCVTNPTEWIQVGRTHHTMGRYEEAVAAFDRAIAADPNNSEAWKNRGLSLAFLGRNEESEESFRRAISANPYDNEIFYFQALSRNLTGNRAGALESLDRAASIAPQNKDQGITQYNVLVMKGNLLMQENRTEEANVSFKKAHEVMMSMI